MVWIEGLIVDVDCLQELIDIELEICVLFKDFFAIWARWIFDKPVVNAINVENMVTVEHSAHWVISNRLQADCTLLNEEFSCFDSNQDFLDLHIC